MARKQLVRESLCLWDENPKIEGWGRQHFVAHSSIQKSNPGKLSPFLKNENPNYCYVSINKNTINKILIKYA